MKSKYDQIDIVDELKRKKVSVNTRKKTISFYTGSLGIKSLGKVDFLLHHCGYRMVY